MSSKIVGRVILDQFRVDAFLDAGGMGSVYKVWDIKRNVPLAMKVLHADLAEDPTMFKRFKREARALQKLAHPNIVPFYGLYQTNDFAFMLERFIDGPTLKDILKQKQGKSCSTKEAIVFLKAICSALGYAHANGVIHCDVKSANVMVDRGGGIFLADFGIARHADSTTTTMAGAGTPAYMAPEQILSKSVSAATDIYALGVLFYELLTGQRPFRGTEKGTESAGATANERIRYAQINLPPPDPRVYNASIPSALSEVLLKALDKQPERRYQSCQEMLDAVCQALGEIQDLIPDRIDVARLGWGGNDASAVNPPPPPPVGTTATPAYPGTPSAAPRKNIWVYFALGAVALIVLVIAMSGGSGTPPVIPNPGGDDAPAVFQPTATRVSVSKSTSTQAPITEPTKTLRPTNTRVSLPTPSPKPKGSCPGAEPQRVVVGDRVRVCTKSDNVIVRSDPQKGAAEYFRIPPGSVATILDGPRCNNDSSWWYVSVPAGTMYGKGSEKMLGTLDTDKEGWVREGSDEIDRYFICKID